MIDRNLRLHIQTVLVHWSENLAFLAPQAIEKIRNPKLFTASSYYYQVPTFWQTNTLRFVSLDWKGFWPRSSSGSCLNYLIHESWFLFDENWISCCCCWKGDHLLTKCHGMSRTAESGWDAKFNLRRAIKCPALICSPSGAWIYATLSRPAAPRYWRCRKHAKQKQSLRNFGIQTRDVSKCGSNFLREFAPGFARAENMLISTQVFTL